MTHSDEAPTAEQVAMARRIAASCPGPVLSPRCHSAMLRGECDDWHGVQAALAAIIETQEADARLAETLRIGGGTLSSWINTNESPMGATRRHIATAIRSGIYLEKPHD